MDDIPCVHCGKFFIPRNRNQNYCTEADCQRARKAAWQRFKMKTDVDYRTQQRLSNEKWVQKTPSYWRRYRQRYPDKAARNRILQHVRNRRNRQTGQDPEIPVIAKMDVSKVNIYIISKGYRGLQRWT